MKRFVLCLMLASALTAMPGARASETLASCSAFNPRVSGIGELEVYVSDPNAGLTGVGRQGYGSYRGFVSA